MEVRLSRDDVRHTLQTHFHSMRPPLQSPTGGSPSIAVASRKRLLSFLPVQKPTSLHGTETKRLFHLGATASKYFVLCVTVQDSTQGAHAHVELHYVHLWSTLSVDVQHSWNLRHLDTIEHSGKGPGKPNGAFALFFTGEVTSWQWLVATSASKTAMLEFLWTVCALRVQNQSALPRLVRLNVAELHDMAMQLRLQPKYEMEIDLAHYIAGMATTDRERNTKEDGMKPIEATAGVDVSGLRLGSPQSNEALELLSAIKWHEVAISDVELELRTRLGTLEDENMAFLLALHGETALERNASQPTSVDKILDATECVQDRLVVLQDWTNESDESLGHISSRMQHFEALNNQLEMHFKNSVALAQVLTTLLAQVELSQDHVLRLTSLDNVFGHDGLDTTRLEPTIKAIAALDQAIKSTREFPAREMVAFRARGVELSKVATEFGEKLRMAFDTFLQRTIKHWTSTRSIRGRRTRDPMAIPLSSSSDDVNWGLTTDSVHLVLVAYDALFNHVGALDPPILASLRQTYSKHLAAIFNAHAQSLFRYLRDKLPRSSKQHFHTPSSVPARASNISSSFFSTSDTMCAAPLLQQALDHLTPLVLSERRLVARLFFPPSVHPVNVATGKYELDELTLMMEDIFEKLPKRMIEFGEAAGARNVLDALSLVVLVSGKLDEFRQQSAFLYNVMVNFQLHMKRMIIKFTEDQESWISAQTVDSKMAGVLGPIKKIVNMIARMEDSVAGKSTDSTLLSIYHMIVPSTMHWIDKMADMRPKDAPLTRLENFLFLSENLKMINASKELPLAQYAAKAHDRYMENLQHYVVSIWEYAFKHLVPLIASIESLMTTVPAFEIQYHLPRQEVRRVLDSTQITFEKCVRVMHDRVKMHFRENSTLLPGVWKQLVAYAGGRMALYALVAGDCYQLRFEPPLERGLEVLNKFAFS